jgi:hypothetical protein
MSHLRVDPVLTALAVCWLTMVSVVASVPSSDLGYRLKAIGRFLCEKALAGELAKFKDSTKIPDVVRIGRQLPDVLTDMRAELQAGYVIEVTEGEGEGAPKDERVTHSIIIRGKNEKGGLRLRMGYDPERNKFHIVGYCGA